MKKILALLTVGLLSAGVAAAQVGSVTGLVVDGLGEPVEGARVSLHNETGCAGYVLTGPDGAYLFEEVAVGVYTVRAGKPQVGSATIEGVEVLEGELTTVDPLVLECSGPGGGSGPQHGPQYQNQKRFGGGSE